MFRRRRYLTSLSAVALTPYKIKQQLSNRQTGNRIHIKDMKLTLITVFAALLFAAGVYSRRHCKCYEVFEFSRSQETWQDARDYCQRIGGDLLKIDNYEEDEHIKSLLKTESMRRRQRGWWIGGKLVNGEWTWADGTPMDYQNFPVLASESFVGSSGARITNYVAIFKDRGAYNWGYLSPRDISRMGFICELD